MALAIVADAGGAASNSFVTVAEADAYLEARLNASKWTGDTAKMQALVEATRELSALATWLGFRATDTQALAWPRQSVPNPDAAGFTDGLYDFGVPVPYYAVTLVPQRVKDACCELALEFLKAGTTDLAARPREADITTKTIDVITTEYAAPSQRAQGLQRYPRVWALIAPLLTTGASQVRLTR